MNRSNSADILGTQVSFLSQQEIINLVKISLELGSEQVVICNTNAYALLLANKDIIFRNILNSAYLNFCDGYGVILAARLLGVKQTFYRNSPPDFIDDIAYYARENHKRIFFLGSAEGVAQLAAYKMTSKFPGLEIKVHHGYFKSPLDNSHIINEINKFKTDILMVGMGMPFQEKWIDANKANLNVGLIMPVGALFDYISEVKVRAPLFLSRYGFEWMWRLAHEPIRLFRRYVFGLPVLYLLVLKRLLFG